MTNKTIRMPQPLLDKWLAALRSGEYKQAQHRLKVMLDDGPGYCCLGVLQMVADGEVETSESGIYFGAPSVRWLNTHDIWFGGSVNVKSYETVSAPYLPSIKMSADVANDGHLDADPEDEDYRAPLDFNTIADAIEAAAEGIPE